MAWTWSSAASGAGDLGHPLGDLRQQLVRGHGFVERVGVAGDAVLQVRRGDAGRQAQPVAAAVEVVAQRREHVLHAAARRGAQPDQLTEVVVAGAQQVDDAVQRADADAVGGEDVVECLHGPRA